MRYCRLLPLLTALWLCLPAQAQDSLFSRPTLKVLHIGNSYTDDATALLQQVAAHSGAALSNICLYKAVRGSGSFKSWCDVYNNCDDQYYWVTKVLGGLYARVYTGKGMPRNGVLFRELLSSVEWDLIILQPVSSQAPYYDQWEATASSTHCSPCYTANSRRPPSDLPSCTATGTNTAATASSRHRKGGRASHMLPRPSVKAATSLL